MAMNAIVLGGIGTLAVAARWMAMFRPGAGTSGCTSRRCARRTAADIL
jgi:hypothetical protein